jgi:hypothetical protein
VSDLQQTLFTAAATAEADELERLCTERLDAILVEFPQWTRVPPNVRVNPRAAQRWVAIVVRIAETLHRLGHSGPLERIAGGAANPIVRWRLAYERAGELNKSGDREEAARALTAILDEMAGATGTAVTDLSPKVHSLLGVIRFEQGDLASARRLTAIARDQCRAAGDADGVRVYTENLALIDAVAPEGPGLDRRETVARAQDLSDATRYHASNDLLRAVLRELAPDDGLRGKVYGLLGLNLYRLGDLAGAREWTVKALDACRRAGDEHGVTIYTANQAVIDRDIAKRSPSGR